MRAVKSGTRPRPLRECPRGWQQLVDACLVADPQLRPTIGGVVEMLSRVDPSDIIVCEEESDLGGNVQ